MIVKKIQLSLTAEMVTKIEELKAELGFSSNSMVWYSALSGLYRSTFPAYARMSSLSPKQKVQEKLKEKEAKAEFELERKREIVERLDGELVKAEGGAEIAHYFTYAGRKRYEQETPLHLITEDLLASQYSPDRPTVERLHKEKKTDW
jgi:hypothetical protein